MDDQDINRLKRLIAISWLLLLAVLVGLTFWASYQIRDLRTQLAARTPPQIINKIGQNGKNGQDGLTVIGATGPQGAPGLQGVQGIAGPKGDTGIMGPQGIQGQQGSQGESGPAGKTLLVRQNPETGNEECRYAGDLAWQPIEDCSGEQ